MWSILTDPLPDVISVNGVVFGVHTDFRVWLQVGQILSDAGKEIKQETLKRLFDLVVPVSEKPNGYILGTDFVEALAVFYAGPQKDLEEDVDEDAEKEKDPQPNKPRHKRTFDFEYDAAFIYQSFASFYSIRLCEVKMHWWEFLELFDGLMLSEGNSMNFVVGVRQKKLSDVPKSRRAAYGKMQKAFSLPKDKGLRRAENAVYDMLEAMWKENDKQEVNDGGKSDH